MTVTISRLLGCSFGVILCLVGARASAAEDEDEVVVSAKPEEKKAPDAKPAEAKPTEAKPPEAKTAVTEMLTHLAFSGFVQADYHGSQASEPELTQGGVLLNENRFLIRAARPRLDVDYTYARAQLELDANTVRGPEVRLFHAFGTAVLPGLRAGAPPLVAASLGLMDTPFGYEVGLLPQRQQLFGERSLASRAFFPGIPDLGMRLFGGLSFVRWSFGLMNGHPLDTAYAMRAPMSPRDVSFRLGVETHPTAKIELRGGVSGLRGKGFHPGTDASKNAISWTDVNEDGTIQPSELQALPATAASPSVLFDRWLVGADVQALLHTKLGLSQLSAEVFVASNMDRGFAIADPVLLGQNTRELGAYVSFIQELGKYAILGLRYDYYDPNLDALDTRAGKLVPNKQSVHTVTPMVGAVLPGHARLLFEYAVVRDHLGRDASGLPTDLKNDAFNLRLQVDL